jgi:DNA repair protein RecN (Recombination protein N)
LLDELQKAKLKGNELEGLEAELNKLENAEDVKSKLQQSAEILSGSEQSIISLFGTTLANLNAISQYGEHFKQLRERLNSCLIEIKDISNEIEGESEQVEIDNEKIARFR